MKKLLCLLCVLFCLTGCARAEIEMFAINVGKGDALLVMADDYVCLIDSGKAGAQERIEAAFERYDINHLDALFVTHCDKDHTGGLKWLRKSGLITGAIYASACHPDKTRDKHPAAKAAQTLGLAMHWLNAGDTVPLGDSGAVFRVYAPIAEIPENEDDNSLVMMLDSPDGRILLTGDMELAEEAALLASDYDLKCDVLKVPNHADTDACSPALIAACAPEIAVISTSSEEKPDTPAPNVMKNLELAGCEIFITEDSAAGISVKLKNGEISAEYTR